jgi:PhnB protein
MSEEIKGLTVHLAVSDCAGFIDFCKQAFGAEEKSRMQEPKGKRILHAELSIGGTRVMLADEFPEMGGKSAKTLGGNPVTLNLTVKDADAASAAAVKAGAKVTMPVADQFWGDRYGQVTDPFGNHWAFAQPKEKLTPEQIAERAGHAMSSR